MTFRNETGKKIQKILCYAILGNVLFLNDNYRYVIKYNSLIHGYDSLSDYILINICFSYSR